MLRRLIAPLFIAAALTLSACGRADSSGQATDGRIQVVASTSIIGDIVSQVGGDSVSVSTLVPIGGDTHTFSPTPQDVARVTSARVVFVNGAGYEEFLATLLQGAGGSAEVVELSRGITLRELAEGEDHAHEEGEAHGESEAHEEGGLDPHVWTDPANVKYWTQTIAETLGRVDAANADAYAENAANFNTQLDELDAWIGAQFAEVPAEQRLLVTDHTVFGYMADRYGLEQIGTILPGYSSAAQPSAQELAALQDEIAEHGVKAIFVGDVANESLAGQIASDTGVRLVTVLTESLTPADGPAPTYIEYMRHNVTAIAEALR